MKNMRKLKFLPLFLLTFSLTGCSIGPIKLIEKIPNKNNTVKYGNMKENEEINKTEKIEKDIEVNPDSDVVASADGYIFKKERFTVSPSQKTVYTSRPKGGNETSVETGMYLSVIAVSDDNSIYLIEVDNKYYFIKSDVTTRELNYDEEKKKEKEEEEQKKKSEEEKKKEEEAKRKKEEDEKKKKEKEQKKKPKTQNIQKNSSSSNTSTNSRTQTSTNSKVVQPNTSTSSSSQNSNTHSYSTTVTDSDTRPSNILMPVTNKKEYEYGIEVAIVNKRVIVNEQASMNSLPGEPLVGTNIYSYGYFNQGDILEITGITSNGYVRTKGPYDTVVYVHGRYLSEI